MRRRPLTKPTVILIEDEEEPRAYVTSVIEEHGFNVVHCPLHSRMKATLAAHPEAVAIVSDVDTDYDGAGVAWAKRYTKAKDHLPVVFTSVLVYAKEADGLGIPAIPKPFVLEGEAIRDTADLAQVADEFPLKLGAWLDELHRGLEPAGPRSGRRGAPAQRH